MAMKRFNLEEYLANSSKKVITREGRAVKIYCTNYIGSMPIIAEIEGSGNSLAFYRDGKYSNAGDNSPFDLFFASKKQEGWINVFGDALEGNYVGDRLFKTKEDAEEEGKKWIGHKAVVKIEWEE